jgi:hypothetical protein
VSEGCRRPLLLCLSGDFSQQFEISSSRHSPPGEGTAEARHGDLSRLMTDPKEGNWKTSNRENMTAVHLVGPFGHRFLSSFRFVFLTLRRIRFFPSASVMLWSHFWNSDSLSQGWHLASSSFGPVNLPGPCLEHFFFRDLLLRHLLHHLQLHDLDAWVAKNFYYLFVRYSNDSLKWSEQVQMTSQ